MTKRMNKSRNWWKRFSGGFRATATRVRKRKHRLNLESLEARNLLAINLAGADLSYLLEQVIIGNDYNQLNGPIDPNGVREVSGENNNLVGGFTYHADGSVTWTGNSIHSDWGQSNTDFLRFLATDHPNIDIPSYGVTYDPVKMQQVTDPGGQTVMAPLDFMAQMQQAVTPAAGTSPRTITQLITSSDVDPASPSYNPAAEAAMVQMGGEPVEVSNTVVGTGQTAFIPDPGVLGGVPFNDFFAMFGQFFDHGLDFITKGGGFVLMPLSPSDPLYDPAPGAQNMMMLSRGALSNPASDFQITGNGDYALKPGVVPAFNNNTGLLIDQSQTFGSHSSINVLVRQYDAAGDVTGKLITGAEDMATSDPGYDRATQDLATWADMKHNALRLGIELIDMDVLDAPLIKADAVGKIAFLPQQTVKYRSDLKIGDTLGYNAANDPFVRWPDGSVKRSGHAIISDMGNAASPVDHMGIPLQPGEYNAALLASHYVSGDHRVNENAGLTAIHHIFHAEHNIQADAIQVAAVQDAVDGDNLAGLNGWLAGDIAQTQLDQMVADHTTNNVIDYQAIADALDFDGEKIYQAARIITESEYNHIAIDQYVGGFVVLPEFVSYSSDINMGVSLEFSQAVFRLGHSQNSEKMLVAIPDTHGVTPGEPGYVPTYEAQDLFDAFLNPSFYQEHGPSGIVAGLLNQHANAVDEFVTSALQQTTVGMPLDLGAIDIARGRDVGLPTLNEMRQQIFDGLLNNTSNNSNGWGIAPYTSWEDFGGHLRHPESLVNFIAAYGRENTIYGLQDMRVAYEAGTSSPFDPTPDDNVVTLQDLRTNAQQILDDAANGVPSGTLFMRGQGSPVYVPAVGTPGQPDYVPAHWDVNNTQGGDLGFWDVDLWIGGLAEQPLFDAPLGTTFSFIMADFGQRMQDADRFYYLYRMPVGHHLGDQIIGEQFADLIMRTTGLEHIGDAFGIQSATFTLDGTSHDNAYDGTFNDLNTDGTATSGSDVYGIHDYFNAIYESLPNSGSALVVANNSFEVDSLATGAAGVTTNTDYGNYTTTAPTGWTIAQGAGGTWNPTTAAVSGDGHVGAQVAYLQIGASMLDQDTGAPMTEGNTYTLTLNIGNRLDMPGTFGATAKLVAVLPNGTPVADLGTIEVTQAEVPTGQWRPVTVSTGPISAAHAGLVLRIEITNSGQRDQVLVDNVHLTETAPGGSANDGHIVVVGLEGNDYIVAALGDDYVYGDAGNDVIEGAQGNDHLYGGPGDDWITDYENDDFIHGGPGNDYISAGPGVLDTAHGGDGDDEVHGGDGIDEVFGGNGDDRLYGEGDTDLMEGGDGHDYMDGGDSVDEEFGGNGNDWLRGGVGDDGLSGGSGNDLMEGGLGPVGNDGDRLIGDSPITLGIPVFEFNGDGTEGDMDIGSYEEVPIAIFANMQTANANGTSSNLLDTYALLEGLVGSAQNDTLTGADANGTALNGVNNYLIGGAGDDTLTGLGDDYGLDPTTGQAAPGRIDFLFGDSVVVDNNLYWVGDPRHTPANKIDTDGYRADGTPNAERLLEGAAFNNDGMITNWYGTGETRVVFEDGSLGHVLGDNGPDGDDTAVYRGNLADYRIEEEIAADGQQAIRITDLRDPGNATFDGIDILVGVEFAQFADQRLSTVLPPTVTIDQAAGQADPTNASQINFTVVFSEPVLGFGDAAADVTLDGTAGATTATVTPTANPLVYNVAVSGMTGSGTVVASIAANVAQDAVGNLNTASTSTDNAVTFTGFNQAPTDIQWNGVTPAISTLPAAGATIANLSTVDADSASWTYSLQAGSSPNFAVSAAGAVTRTGSAMATNQTYTVIVKSDDGGGGSRTETFTIRTGSNASNTIAAAAADDTIIYGDDGHDTTTGGAGNDTLFGMDENDTLNGGGGNDVLNGGTGDSDTASYGGAAGGVTVSLAIAGPQNTVGAGFDTLVDIENLTGGEGDDNLTGNAAANVLDGGAGADILTGGGGGDTVNMGVLNDDVQDTVRFTAPTDFGPAGTQAFDTITNFDANGTADRVEFGGLLNTLFDDGTTDGNFAFFTGNGVNGGNTPVDLAVFEALFLSGANGEGVSSARANDLDNAWNVATEFNAEFNLIAANGEATLLVINDTNANSAALWRWVQNDGDTDNAVDASELTLIAMINANATVTTGSIGFAPVAPLLATSVGVPAGTTDGRLNPTALRTVVQAAIADWASTGLSAELLSRMRQVQFVVTDMPGSYLGMAADSTIYLDADAAGHGWFVDRTPSRSEEFRGAAGGDLRAVDRRAVDRMDLLTVVAHELGHIAGLDDLEAQLGSLMSGTLSASVRRTAWSAAVDKVFGG